MTACNAQNRNVAKSFKRSAKRAAKLCGFEWVGELLGGIDATQAQIFKVEIASTSWCSRAGGHARARRDAESDATLGATLPMLADGRQSHGASGSSKRDRVR